MPKVVMVVELVVGVEGVMVLVVGVEGVAVMLK